MLVLLAFFTYILHKFEWQVFDGHEKWWNNSNNSECRKAISEEAPHVGVTLDVTFWLHSILIHSILYLTQRL